MTFQIINKEYVFYHYERFESKKGFIGALGEAQNGENHVLFESRTLSDFSQVTK